jgi:hypothetical protein
VEASEAPGIAEAAAIAADYQVAMSGLRSFVTMGLRLMDVKARLPHGGYLPWCEKFLPKLSKPHLHRAKSIAQGLCEILGVKCLARETFENLPVEMAEIIDGASGYRALLGTIKEFRTDADEARAKATCESFFAADPALRDEWEPRVLAGEMSWCEAVRGIAGHVATAGKKRGEPNYVALLPQSLTTLRNGFAKWGDLPEETRAKAVVEFRSLAAAMPPELRDALKSSL